MITWSTAWLQALNHLVKKHIHRDLSQVVWILFPAHIWTCAFFWQTLLDNWKAATEDQLNRHPPLYHCRLAQLGINNQLNMKFPWEVSDMTGTDLRDKESLSFNVLQQHWEAMMKRKQWQATNNCTAKKSILYPIWWALISTKTEKTKVKLFAHGPQHELWPKHPRLEIESQLLHSSLLPSSS